MEEEKNIRMIGLDLDGTVFDWEKRIRPHTRETIQKAIDQGVLVLPATGRPECGLPEQFMSIPGVRYAVTSNGARVVEYPSGKTVYEELIPWQRALDVLHTMRQWNISSWEVYYGGKTYVEESEYKFVFHDNMSQGMRDYILRTRIPVKDLIGKIEREQICMEKLHMLFDDTDQRDRIMEQVKQQYPDLAVCYATCFNLEINSGKSGKGIALLKLGEQLGISREEIMACGDAPNDWNMLEQVGFPVVMENGDEETKKKAAFITRSNEEDGVAYAIEQFVLKK